MPKAIDFTGKKCVVFGVANQRSIAFAISQQLAAAGAEMVFAYQNERLKDHVEKAVATLGQPGGSAPLLVQCDALDEAQVSQVYEETAKRFGRVDLVVHCIAFAQHDDLGGEFSKTNLAGFRTALEVSAYTLMPIVSKAVPLMGEQGGSVVALTFDASNRVYPGYNIMGTAKAALENIVRQLAAEYGPKKVRVNAVSAGPLPTLAARSIPGFSEMRAAYETRSAMKRNVNHEEVANASLFLLSDLASGITGAVIPVDAGYSIMGL